MDCYQGTFTLGNKQHFPSLYIVYVFFLLSINVYVKIFSINIVDAASVSYNMCEVLPNLDESPHALPHCFH